MKKKDKKKNILKKSIKKEAGKKNKEVTKKKKVMLVKDESIAVVSEEDLKIAFDEIVDQYQTIHNMPQFYGNDALYYRSEINILNTISEIPGANLTAIAKALNISKSAISKGTLKLIKKELITKDRSPVSNREVVFNLTPDGKALYNHIKAIHEDLYARTNQVFENLSYNDKNVISQFTKNLHDALSVSIEQLKK
ncbi:MAG: winged helix DNA-binding protein [Eubacterium sp.]